MLDNILQCDTRRGFGFYCRFWIESPSGICWFWLRRGVLFQKAKLLALEEVIEGQFPEDELDFVAEWMKTNYVKEELDDDDHQGTVEDENQDSDEEDADGDRPSSPKYEEEDKKNLFQCSYAKCQKTFLSKKCLWQHKSRDHIKHMQYLCKIF